MILGVTGGIASGKSTVAQVFRELGAIVVSADELARQAVLPGTPALRQLVERFGPQVLCADGTLDRAALSRIVFADPRARQDLNRITHPAIAALAEKRLAELRRQNPLLVVYEAPLLFEAGAEGRVDAVLSVIIDERLQLNRLMARDRSGPEAAQARIAAQMPQSEKAARSDYLIDNSGSLEQLRQQVQALWSQLTGRGPAAGPADRENR
ncbi:dephospho-CoA kinase [Desulfuromonas versatilis]|uniref:Dephospho-CoA kinase n=1 Tax=Desulfuromonas versatilis TaxID=2802975 RepID=A0ABM8HUZ6_9BACT|nr:dephospho-CoA kinase [Desulfuromonas versatilis]